MTRVLADDPELLRAYAGDGERISSADLEDADASLWALLGGAASAWVGKKQASGGFWHRIALVSEASTSQYDVLQRHAGRDLRLAGPIACLALTGRAFHGQRGRPWEALAGNVHLSVALAPRTNISRLGLALTMLPAVAVVDAVRTATGGRLVPDLKWVNDVLVQGRKVAGVLTGTQVQGQCVEVAVLGIGVNVARTPPLRPTPFVPAADCLRDCEGGEGLTAPDLFWPLLDALAARFLAFERAGPEELFAAYRERSLVIGRAVRIWEEGLDEAAPPSSWPPPLARGVVLDLARDLTLRLQGHEARVTRGRLVLEEVCKDWDLGD